ncbi:hypothetical protein [Cryobacterium breve]|uniref:hypothetical protein n=1 Tax=Cryobacterium breve TaxID=1259258 RepID=UPI00248BE347|nr:hypothetical protein [Cryobacterium breve]
MLKPLPDYPWDQMAPYAAQARAHADGIVDLSIGSPVDPTPDVVRTALAEATDAHAYPQTVGTPELQAAIVGWYARRRGVTGLTAANVLPTIGSKESSSPSCPSCSGSARGTPSCTRLRHTPPTRSAPRWPDATRSPPTTRPRGRPRRGSSG